MNRATNLRHTLILFLLPCMLLAGLPLFCLLISSSCALAAECTVPESKFADCVKPNIAEKYQYVEDGDFSTSLKIPVYEWLPAGAPPRAVILAIHGLTLHGRRFRVLARTLAANDVAFLSIDMRGFGACFADKEGKFNTAQDDKSKVNHEKSYEDIVQLATMVRKKYPGIKFIAMGECMGCTFCVRLAAEHPELIDGMILSGPCVKVNPSMYMRLSTIPQGLKALCTPSHNFPLDGLIARLVSPDPQITNEDLEDPLIRKKIPLPALLGTKVVVDKTATYGKRVRAHFPVLIFQFADDRCVSPKRVVNLLNNVKSDDQILAWRDSGGHLQFETPFMRVEVVEEILNWFGRFGHRREEPFGSLRQQIIDAGGTIVD